MAEKAKTAAASGTPAANAAVNPQKKSAEFTQDQLKDVVKSAMKEVMDEGDGSTADPGADAQAALEQAIEAVTEKHKSRKDAGEEVEDPTAAEILQEAVALVSDVEDESMEDPDADPDAKDDDNADDESKDDDTEQDAKRRKSAAAPAQRKAAPARSRKYADIFYGGRATAAKQQKKASALVQLARAIKCSDVFGRHDPERAAFYAKKFYGDDQMSREFKALSATNPTAGGFLIPEVYLDEVIELLYSKTVIKELGARTIPLETGNLNIPRMTSGVRAMWGGEARKIKVSQPAFGNLRLSAKRLECIVPQTRELIMSTKYSADEIFANDLARRMQLGLDWGGLYGTGGEFQPTGIANTPGVEVIDATKLDAQYADTDGKITADFPVYVRALVMSKNVDDQALGWAFNSFTESIFMNMKTTTGDYIYREEMNSGKLMGAPYLTTNQIPTDKNGKTDIFFGNWADLMIGDQMGLETYTTLEGSWTDENGVQHNAFEENLTGTRALMYDDIGVRHVESFAYIKNVKVVG